MSGNRKNHNYNKVWIWNSNSPFCVQLIKKLILLQNTHQILPPKNEYWWCSVQDWLKIKLSWNMEVFIFTIIDFNKIYSNHMCNANNLFLTIRAMEICMFSKLTIGCKVLWRPIKVMEDTWVIVFCCWILGSLVFKYCEKLNWSIMDFFYCWGFDRAS
jgi:hypothetical protein